MTNEKAGQNLILMFNEWAQNVQPSSEKMKLACKAVQIATYALSYASGSGVQFDKNTEGIQQNQQEQ